MKNIQDIFALVEQPSRYLGSEINAIRKDLRAAELRIALAFPDMYEIGTSHFGLQILYHILNQQKNIAAERVFAPGSDMEAHLRSSGIPLLSHESREPIRHFDIIGFSLLYELNFTNILMMLDLAGIPFFASERDDSHPFIIAGGPCTCNPEPVADFFDAMVVGDGETVILKMTETWFNWKQSGNTDKENLLKLWSGIEGVYIPAFFEPKYSEAGLQTLLPRFSNYINVKRTLVNDLDAAPFPNAPVVPYGKPVHDRLRIEIARGCTRGCRFCQAGMIYRPVRERSRENILRLTETSLGATGYEDISLLSLSTGDYSCIAPLMEQLMVRYAAEHVAVSFPSLRAGTLTPQLMEFIKQVRKTGFTIAPEAGTQRLRDVINKNITEQDITETVTEAFRSGWQVIKLYFMVGLPTETDEDIQGIVDIVRKLWKMKIPGGRKGKINVSVGTFIPKSHTPFQWVSQISLAESKEKIYGLQAELKLPGIQFKWQHPQTSLIEGLTARGDRRLSRVLAAAYRKGCKFDAWTDSFQYDLWEETFSDTVADVDFYTTRKRDMQEPLPWDHIDIGITRDFLKTEWEKAVAEKHTQDCRNGDCNACGVCDFETVKPRIGRGSEVRGQGNEPPLTSHHSPLTLLELSYSKLGEAKYFGHLELANIFIRAVRRAGIPVKYSEGFHPLPKISFNDPLPVGIESMNELMYLSVPETVKPENITEALNRQLPKGIIIKECRIAPPKSQRKSSEQTVWRITLPARFKTDSKIGDSLFDKNKLQSFTDASECFWTHINPKGNIRKINLKEAVLKILLTGPCELEITLKSE
ncbi:MAG: B12-binding domain-containing radical SAM protein, partial [Desulfobacteraceae bacterium IS3]